MVTVSVLLIIRNITSFKRWVLLFLQSCFICSYRYPFIRPQKVRMEPTQTFQSDSPDSVIDWHTFVVLNCLTSEPGLLTTVLYTQPLLVPTDMAGLKNNQILTYPVLSFYCLGQWSILFVCFVVFCFSPESYNYQVVEPRIKNKQNQTHCLNSTSNALSNIIQFSCI